MSEPVTATAGASAAEVVDAENPWPGLASFEERYASFFFGRDREENSLLQRVLRQRLTVLTGRSGMGKTSLLRAGLFPRLRQEQVFPVYISLDILRLDSRKDSFGLSRQIFDAILDRFAGSSPTVPAEPSLPSSPFAHARVKCPDRLRGSAGWNLTSSRSVA
jgi:AAA+ ATPase superfamily predicted ATPase